MLELLILLLTGVATGFLNVMAGGGSMLSVPVMIFLGIPGTVANGTNRIAILPQDITATFAFYRKGFANFKLSLSLGLCTIPGAIIGASFASHIDSQQFNLLLAFIMLIVLGVMALPQKTIVEHDSIISTQRIIAGHILMVLVGFWGGFIHIGVGFLLMPILNRVMLLDLVTTNMHKVFIVICYTVVALIVFASQLELVWKYGITLAIGTSTGGWLAANFQIKQGIGVVRWALNTLVCAFIIKLLFFS